MLAAVGCSTPGGEVLAAVRDVSGRIQAFGEHHRSCVCPAAPARRAIASTGRAPLPRERGRHPRSAVPGPPRPGGPVVAPVGSGPGRRHRSGPDGRQPQPTP